MSVSKSQIYNLALSALMLDKEVIEPSTDKSSVVRVLNTHYEIALSSTLEDLDLDSLSTDIALELIENLTGEIWEYVYKYPVNCAFLRRIKSEYIVDNRFSHIPKKTGLYKGQSAIYTNKFEAIAKCIPNDLNISALSVMAAMAVSYKLAFLSAPLITGKGAVKLRKDIEDHYIIAKHEAQEKDSRENFNYEDDASRSEFVTERLS